MHPKSFDKISKSLKLGYIILSILFGILGIMILSEPVVSTITLCCALGIIMVFFGLVKITGYFFRDLYRYVFQYDLVYGIILLIFGIVLLLHPSGILTIFYTIAGIIFLTDGLCKIQLAIDIKRILFRQWWLVLIFAILTIMLGILMVLQPMKSAEFVTTLLGFALLSEGILNLFTMLFASKSEKF